MDFKIHDFIDERALLQSHELMAACFKDRSALSLDFLRWFYLENPFGTGFGSMVHDKESAVSQVCVIPQQMSFNGETRRVGLVVNACTLAQYQRRGLLSENIRLITEEAGRRGFHFLYLFPNPASFGGFIKNNFSVVQELSLEVAPVDYRGIVRELMHKERFETLATTEDLEVSLPEGTNFKPVSVDETGATGLQPARLPENSWYVPLTREQLNWRYLSHPTRRYHAWRHMPTGETVVVRFINLYGMSSCVLMKTSCADRHKFNRIMRDLKVACKGLVSFITMFHSGLNSGLFSLLAHGRLIVPSWLAPRKFPLIFYPLQHAPSGRLPRFELSIGDNDAI